MEQHQSREFIPIEAIMAKGRKNHREPKIKNFYVNNKVSDLIEKEKDLELNKKLFECNFNINDAFNVIMSSNLTDDSVYEKTKNKVILKNPNKKDRKDKNFSLVNQGDLMDLGVNRVKPKLQKRGTLIKKDFQNAGLNLNNTGKNKQIDLKAPEADGEKAKKLFEAGNDNWKNFGTISQSNYNIGNLQNPLLNTQRNFSRRETNFSQNNYTNLQNNNNFKLKSNFDLHRKQLKTSIESKSNTNLINTNTNSNNCSSKAVNRFVLYNNRINESHLNKEDKEVKVMSTISSRTNTNFFNNNNTKKNSLNISSSQFPNFNSVNNNKNLNSNNPLSPTGKPNFNKFNSEEKTNEFQEEDEEAFNQSMQKNQRKISVYSPNKNMPYSPCRSQKTEDEIALKYNRDLRTLKKYENLKDNYFPDQYSIQKDSSADEDIDNFFDSVKGSKIKSNQSKDKKQVKEMLSKDFNKTVSNLKAFKLDTKKTSEKPKNESGSINERNNLNINGKSINIINNLRCTGSKESQKHMEPSRSNDEKFKINFSTNLKRNNNKNFVLNNNNNEIKNFENVKEYSRNNKKCEFDAPLNSPKSKLDLRFEKKDEIDKNLPSAFLSRCEGRMNDKKNFVKDGMLNLKENFAQENKMKRKK